MSRRALTMSRQELEAAGVRIPGARGGKTALLAAEEARARAAGMNVVRLGPDSPLLTKARPVGKAGDQEHLEQVKLIQWIEETGKHHHPELERLFAIPNFLGRGSKTARIIAGTRAKAEGRRKGVPDLCLPVARGGYFGLYLELKPADGSGRVKPEQKAWAAALTEEGYLVLAPRGFEQARAQLLRYVRLERTVQPPKEWAL